MKLRNSSKLDQKKFDLVKQWLELKGKRKPIAKVCGVSVATIYRIGQSATLEDYKRLCSYHNKPKRLTAKEKFLEEGTTVYKNKELQILEVLEKINTKLGVIENVLVAVKNEAKDDTGFRPFKSLFK